MTKHPKSNLDSILNLSQQDIDSLTEQLKPYLIGYEERAADPDNRSDTFRSAEQMRYYTALVAEYSKRFKEGLRLYRPLPAALGFHQASSKRVALIGSNRAGKTLTAASDVAWVATGTHPHHKSRVTDGRMICVGKDENHVGRVMWRKLAVPGAFMIVPDEDTNQWRTVRPNDERNGIDPVDLDRKKLWRPAPPLIPPRLIKRISWAKKREAIPSLLLMKNGWEIYFRSSKGEPDQGIDIDWLWIDEEIKNQGWYSEMVARLLDREGCSVWSCTPQNATEALDLLLDKCESGEPEYEQHRLLVDDNPYISSQSKALFYSDLSGLMSDEIAVRYYGERRSSGLRVYPEFKPDAMHNAFWPVSERIPQHWTRYMVLDPGYQFCATLFAAVSPDDAQVHLYDELYLRQSDQWKWAKAVKERMTWYDEQGEPQLDKFETFIIDWRMGRTTNMASGRTFAEHYAEALEKEGIFSFRSDNSFEWGSDDIRAREAALRSWMHVRGEERPRMAVHSDRLPMLKREMAVQFYEKDKPNKRVDRNNHLVHCAEYLAGYDPHYVDRGHQLPKGNNPVYDRFQAKQKTIKERRKYFGGSPHPLHQYLSGCTVVNIGSGIS